MKLLRILVIVISLVLFSACISPEIASVPKLTGVPNETIAISTSTQPSKVTPTLTPTPIGGSEYIAFIPIDESKGTIYKVNTSGGDNSILADILPPFYGIGNPAWSPDGDKLAFAEFEFAGQGRVYIVNNDGRNLHKLTDTYIAMLNDLYRFVPAEFNRC